MLKTKFLKPDRVLIEAGIRPGMTVADLGAGNGFFMLAASDLVGEQGRVLGVDILEEALGRIMAQARLERRKNIRTMRCDLDSQAIHSLPELSFDFVILGKVLAQIKHPENLIRETYKILKTGGFVLVVEWKKENAAFPQPLEYQLTKEQIKQQFRKHGFHLTKELDTDKYHFALVFKK